MYELTEKLKDLRAYDPVTADDCIALDANESFISVSENIRRGIADAVMSLPFERYPDHRAKILCETFAELYALDKNDVVAGNGSDELISVIFGAFLMRGEAFATLEPDFSMYAFYGHLCEGRHIRIEKKVDFSIDVDNVIKTCNNEGVKLLVLSNPCNPTSVGLEREEMRRLVKGVEALVVLDEAYMDFWNQSLLEEYNLYDNLIVLKTCSKAIGMAAARLGFAVSCKRLADALRAAKSPYNVGALPQAAGSVILSHRDELERARVEILSSREMLYTAVKEIESKYPGVFNVLYSRTNFLCIRIQKPEKLFEFLLENRVRVRLTGGIIRVTCGKEQENASFIRLFGKYISGQ